MTSAIFYMSLHPGPGRVRIEQDGYVVYVRMSLRLGLHMEEALDQACPRQDEAVMNTHDITEAELVSK